ncbi:MAG TPA: glycosyltransferase family 4 protein [Candidatus Deferrimicrobiaceae bacterium]|jgi:glycosyltransferase involved in cell wall biosynthesis
MRIAYVTPEYVTERSFSGGLANYVHRLSLSLIGMGHEPVVFVPADRDERLVHDGIEVHRVATKSTIPWAGLLNRITLRRHYSAIWMLKRSQCLCGRVKNEHRRAPFSIVQFPHLGGLSLFRPRGIPAVVRLSSYSPLWAKFGEYDSMPMPVLHDQQWLERQGLLRADGIFGPCGFVGAVVEKDLGRPVTVIETPFVMDTERTDDSVYRELLQGRPYLLFVGRFSIAKGMITIADALPELLGRHPDLLVVLVGREQGGYKGASVIDHLWQKAGPHRGRVLFLGDMRHDLLYPVMKHAAAVLIPSLVENFPNVCLEAMAQRCVILGTRGTSLEQLLTDGESGLLFEAGNPAALAVAVERALALTGEARAAMGEKSGERLQTLRPERVVEKLLAYYQSVIDRAGAGKDGGAIR